jgi:hypothetical protein
MPPKSAIYPRSFNIFNIIRYRKHIFIHVKPEVRLSIPFARNYMPMKSDPFSKGRGLKNGDENCLGPFSTGRMLTKLLYTQTSKSNSKTS